MNNYTCELCEKPCVEYGDVHGSIVCGECLGWYNGKVDSEIVLLSKAGKCELCGENGSLETRHYTCGGRIFEGRICKECTVCPECDKEIEIDPDLHMMRCGCEDWQKVEPFYVAFPKAEDDNS